jgi:RHS repeat-associated protein
VLGIANMNRSFTYDAENRQAAAAINSTNASYVYDGLGQRVQKTVNGTTTTYVYDAFGNLAAEYGPSEASPCTTTMTCYVSVDHLGSTRMLMDANGNAQRRYDYLPFGGELLASTGNRTTTMGYLTAPDDLGPKFTGQSRDPDTVLDWFNVRYMSPAQGRFQSVDPGNAGADPSGPQTWNMYSYVTNNPLSYTDPSGMGFWSDLGNFFLGIGGDDLQRPHFRAREHDLGRQYGG